jgi:hypothetical protein
MKMMFVMKYPNVDLVADTDNPGDRYHYCRNVCICQWMDGKYVSFYPFKAAKDLNMIIDHSSISTCFEVSDDLAELHDKAIAEFRENPTKFISKAEYEQKMKERKEKVTDILKK